MVVMETFTFHYSLGQWGKIIIIMIIMIIIIIIIKRTSRAPHLVWARSDSQ